MTGSVSLTVPAAGEHVERMRLMAERFTRACALPAGAVEQVLVSVGEVATAHLRNGHEGMMTLTLRVTDEHVSVAVGEESTLVDLDQEAV
jgi:hypothetical protein